MNAVSAGRWSVLVVACVVMTLGAAGCAKSAGGADDAKPMTPPTIDAGGVVEVAEIAEIAEVAEIADTQAPPAIDGALASPCATAGTLCWDFEEGTIPVGWTAYRNEFVGALLVDSSKAHRGQYALHVKDFRGGVEGQQGGPKHTLQFTLPPGFGPQLWGRAYVLLNPEVPASHAGLFNARYPRPGMSATAPITALNWYEVATYMTRYMTIWHPPEPPGYPEWVQLATDTDPLIVDRWACLEWQFDGGNGTAPQAADPRLWRNGVEVTWPTTMVFADPPSTTRPTQEKAADFTKLEVGVYLYQGLTKVTNWWIDDLAVGKQRIGCD